VATELRLPNLHNDVRPDAVEGAARHARNGEQVLGAAEGAALLAESNHLLGHCGPNPRKLLEFFCARCVEVDGMVRMFVKSVGNRIAQIHNRFGDAAAHSRLHPEGQGEIEREGGQCGNQPHTMTAEKTAGYF